MDDCLVVSDMAKYVIRNEIGEYFRLKEESIGNPSQYLRGKLRKFKLDNGSEAWDFGSKQYVEEEVNNVATYLEKRNHSLDAKAPTQLSSGYFPEIDISPELEATEASYYHSLIGILRWMVELGRIDVCCEISMLSSHLALPREGHLEEVFHVFAYLKKHMNSEIVFDPTFPEIDMNDFQKQDWSWSIYSSPGE